MLRLRVCRSTAFTSICPQIPPFDYPGEYDENWPMPEFLSIDQYRQVIFRPDAHFINGRIQPRTLGDSVHSAAVSALSGLLHPIALVSGLTCCVSLRLQTSPTIVRVCDFVVISKKPALEAAARPLICIEVLSEGQQHQDELGVLNDYLAMGVENIWLIDPIRRSASIFDATGLRDADPTCLAIPGSPIVLDLTDVFAAND